MKTNVNLGLLKKLYSVLDELVTTTTNVGNLLEADPTEEKYREYVVELYKSVGILTAIAQESSLLIGDIQKLIKYAYPADKQAQESALENALESLLGTSKTKGDRN